MPPPSLRKLLRPCPMLGNKPTWWQILKDNGYPTNVAVLDFETFFSADYSMSGKSSKGLSTIEYIMDPRFEEIGHAAVLMTQPFGPVQSIFWFKDGPNFVEHLRREYGPSLEGCTVVAQNAAFDATILARHYNTFPKFCIDLLGLARHEDPRDRNDLGTMAKRFDLPPKGETKQFSGLRLADMSEEQRRLISAYGSHDSWLEWHIFTYLLPRLSNAAVELPLIQHTLELFTRPSLTVNQSFAAKLSAEMRAEVTKALAVVGHTEDEISGNKSFGGILGKALDAAGDSVAKYQKDGKPKKDGTPVKLLALAKTDDSLEVLKSHPNQRVKDLITARTSLKSWPNHASRVERIAAQARAAGGLLPVPFKYCGAHTGRWSGGEKINLQNLSSRGNDLVNSVRHIIEAPEGFELAVVDSAQVEARGLAWIAGQEDLCQAFRDGRDVYSELATKMCGRLISKPADNLPNPVRKMMKRMRDMGKVGTLGGGYGMGADKCQGYASNSYGVDMTLVEATNLIQTYRKSVPQITTFWRMIEQKFKAAARYHEPGEMARGLKFHWEKENDITVITLPNGRTLKYRGVRVSIINGKDSMWMPDAFTPGKRTFMWGGFLTENVVQALCRDILAEGVLKTEAKGWHVPLHVHDEIIAFAPKGKGEQAKNDIIEILSTPPTWAIDCPLSAEGKVTTRYEK